MRSLIKHQNTSIATNLSDAYKLPLKNILISVNSFLNGQNKKSVNQEDLEIELESLSNELENLDSDKKIFCNNIIEIAKKLLQTEKYKKEQDSNPIFVVIKNQKCFVSDFSKLGFDDKKKDELSKELELNQEDFTKLLESSPEPVDYIDYKKLLVLDVDEFNKKESSSKQESSDSDFWKKYAWRIVSALSLSLFSKIGEKEFKKPSEQWNLLEEQINQAKRDLFDARLLFQVFQASSKYDEIEQKKIKEYLLLLERRLLSNESFLNLLGAPSDSISRGIDALSAETAEFVAKSFTNINQIKDKTPEIIKEIKEIKDRLQNSKDISFIDEKIVLHRQHFSTQKEIMTSFFQAANVRWPSSSELEVPFNQLL